MLRRRTAPIPGGLGDGWVIRATIGSRFIGWLTVKSVVPGRETKIVCNEISRKQAELLSSAPPFKFERRRVHSVTVICAEVPLLAAYLLPLVPDPRRSRASPDSP